MQTALKQANDFLRKGQYEEAIKLYRQAQEHVPELARHIESNIQYVEKKTIISLSNKGPLYPSQVQTTPKCGPIYHNPLVSIIAVNYNGEDDLTDFFESLKEQIYRNFEIIIVDNNSSDRSKSIINDYLRSFPRARLIECKENLGFAAGNNAALKYCRGELIALLNIDTRVDSSWLKELVDAMALDGSCAAVASKTLFYRPFQDIQIKSSSSFSINVKSLINSLVYKKYFIRSGKLSADGELLESDNNEICLSLPVQSSKINFVINFSHKKNNLISYKIGHNKNVLLAANESVFNIELSYDLDSVINSSYIINNAGSVLRDGMPADRGFGEYDNGQYDKKCYVDFFCGVSVLLRRSAILNRDIFIPEFFAYYEDSELSRWITDNGDRIVYAPRSIVYHKHSSTSSEGSHLWHLLVSRSRNIFQYNGNAQKLYEENNHLEEFYKKNIPITFYNKLKNLTNDLRDRLLKENQIIPIKKAIGIYNSYWNTKGGGESHALAFASYFQNYGTVYLISEYDFDIDELGDYYNIRLDNCVKIVEPNFSTEHTSKFFIFINSTYRSNLNSLARHSFYIVSFPHIDLDMRILECYKFLFNSNYTKYWSEKYWGGSLDGNIIYPIGGLLTTKINEELIGHKQKIILSVGRFFVGEHSKNQHIIVDSFKQLVDQRAEYGEWKLVLIGSLNEQNLADLEYFNSIKRDSKGYNIELIANADRQTLESYYERAYLYVHASGYGHDQLNEPNKFEHFGIVVVEAMIHGCWPIVYAVGGPAEIVNHTRTGESYMSQDELIKILEKFIKYYPRDLSYDVMSAISVFLEENNFTHALDKTIKHFKISLDSIE